MISYNLDTIESVKKLVNICDKYKENIDVVYGRQIIDGKSIMGIASLIGHIVGIEIITDDYNVKEMFRKEFKNEI